MKSKLIALVILSLTSVTMAGLTYTNTVEYIAGSGDNSAAIVIDFDGLDTFVFEYHWDQTTTATGWEALLAIEAAGGLDVVAETYSWGVWLKNFIYPGAIKYDYGQANTGWCYYLSGNGADWKTSGIGVSDRVLTNGSWDSWVWTNYSDDWSVVLRQPGQLTVPEPTSMFLLGLGSLMLSRFRRK